jgi:hypothetical protein
MKRNLLTNIFSFISIFVISSAQAQTDQFAYAVTDIDRNGMQWSVIRKLDLTTGEYSPIIFNGIIDNVVAFDAVSKKKLIADVKNKARLAKPFANGVAAMAFDRKHNRLYFTPMFIDQLRYIDLNTMKLYYVHDQPFTGLGDWQQDQGKIVTRMVIAPDGNGYAITNDGSTFVKFTTGKKVKITQLGSLVDDPVNAGMSIINNINSFGGDMIATDDGSFYLVTARNHVFTIDPDTRVAKHLGAIQNLPQNFTANGMVVDAAGSLLVSSAVDANKWYVVDPLSLKADPYKTAVSVFRSSDLANSNILSFRRNPATIPVIEQQKAKLSNLVQVYPNPVTANTFAMEFTDLKQGSYTVELVDLAGRQVMQQKINLNFKDQVQRFSLSPAQAKGIYFVKVLDLNKKNVFEQKLILQ